MHHAVPQTVATIMLMSSIARSHSCMEQRQTRAVQSVTIEKGVCCAGPGIVSQEVWHTNTLRLTPQFAPLVSGNLRADEDSIGQAQSRTFTVPASVQDLHLLSPSGQPRDRVRYRPVPMGAPLRKLHVDLDAWDAAEVRFQPALLLSLQKASPVPFSLAANEVDAVPPGHQLHIPLGTDTSPAHICSCYRGTSRAQSCT